MTAAMETLSKRYYGNGNNCQGGYSYYGGCYTAWDSWARWVVLGLIVIGALLIFFLFSCVTARRRRRMGYQPYRGTHWALGRTPPGHNPPAPYQQQPYYASQQPQYETNAPPAYGANNDYYGRQNDVELQSPPAAYGGYNRGDNVYSPPLGPPPAKNDGIVR